jgi:hypothetical protein
VTPSGILIPAGATTSSVTPRVNGIAFGSSIISASAVGFPTATQSVLAADTISFSPATLSVPAGTTGHLFLFLSAPAPSPNGLVINVTSDTPTVATVPTTVNFSAGSTSTSVAVTGVGTGMAVIHASNLPSVADTTANVTVISGTPASITATSGTPQSVPVNTAYAPMVVIVKDGGGNPIGNVTVTFNAPGAGPSGTFSGGMNTAMTNASGLAAAGTFTANGLPGPFTVTATVSGVSTPASFSLSNTLAVPTITATSGSGQSEPINTAFPPLVALVKNAMGTPVGAGVTVTFSAPASGASGTFMGGVTTTTNASGVATAPTFTGNSIAGSYSVTATAPGVVTPAVYSLTNLPGSPFSITATGGTPQSAAVNTTFANLLVALVKDSGGNPVPNVTVTFTPPASSGPSGTFALGQNTAMTNASGVAISQPFTANGMVGSYTVIASSGSATNASYSLNNVVNTVPGIQIPSGAIVGLGSTTLFPVTLGAPAPPGGVFVTLTSSNPLVVGLIAPNVVIQGGQTTGSVTPRLVGVAFGSATITASAVGYASAMQTVQTTDVLSFSPAVATISGTRGTLFLELSVPAPPGGLTINLISSNPSIASVPATVTIPANATNMSVAVTAVSPGMVTIQASQLPNIAATTASVTID